MLRDFHYMLLNVKDYGGGFYVKQIISGYYSSDEVTCENVELYPAMSVHSSIVFVKKVKKGVFLLVLLGIIRFFLNKLLKKVKKY